MFWLFNLWKYLWTKPDLQNFIWLQFMGFNGLTWQSLSIKYLNYSKTSFLSAVFRVSNIFWVDFHKWELKSFRKFEIFRKKCIIHIVELDELFPKIWGRTLKTACGRWFIVFGTNRSRDAFLTSFLTVRKRFWGLGSRLSKTARTSSTRCII